MYLYHYSPVKEEVLFYHFHSDKESIQPRTRYLNRLMTKGSLRNHTITIQYLNTNDSGIYKCVYKDIDAEVVCNDYTLFISGAFFFLLMLTMTASLQIWITFRPYTTVLTIKKQKCHWKIIVCNCKTLYQLYVTKHLFNIVTLFYILIFKYCFIQYYYPCIF